ncbi:MAG: HlyC/CorC family transporter [Ruminococcaceae bacterium]|nr:HlyC/CorC family transporter [Oscillospiraceae bacterium]
METVIWQILVQIILIALNAFFAASEIAVISLNEVKLKRQAEEGDAKAKKMLRMVENSTGFLSTIQVGITLAGFLGSAFAADGFSEYLVRFLVNTCKLKAPVSVLDTVSVVVITLVLSFFTLVFGELVPKRVAMRNPEKLARRVCGFISGLSVAMRPVVWLLSVSTNGTLRLFGINPKENTEDVSEEDILDLVDAVEEQGEIDSDTKEMIENVFEFDNTTVGEIMTRRSDMRVLYETDSSEEILRTIQESGLSRFPVCGEDTDDIKGIALAREYLFMAYKNPECRLSDVMQKARFVPDTLPANRLFRDMRDSQMHMAIVVDEYGQTAGLITMEDLLESIVGNIYDETDEPELPEIVEEEPNHWQIAGITLIEDAEKAIGVTLRTEEGSYDTFGGFVIANLEYIPQDGETPEFTYQNLTVRILAVTDKRIEMAEVIKTEPEETVEPEASEHGEGHSEHE